MGEVWLAQHGTYADFQAAFKFCLDPQSRGSLLGHEGRVVARLKALALPGVVHMQSAGPNAVIPWLKYDYIPDGDLTALLHRWKDEPASTRTPKVLDAWLRLIDIVASLHDLDDPIIHRDLEPANVLVR